MITENTAEENIKTYFEQENATERSLGSKYLTKIDPEEAGSTLEFVNKKNSEGLMMDEFLKDFNKN